MSITTLRKKLSLTVVTLSKLGGVKETKMQRLANFVKETRKKKGLSTPDVERNSGFQITDGYVSQIENLYVKNVSPEKLSALAKGLAVTEEEIFAVARGIEPNDNTVMGERFKIISLKFQTLSGEKKRDAEALMKALERAVQE